MNIIDFLINAVLILIMFGLGLTLKLSDFKNIFVNPKALFSALFIQIFIIPIIAFFIGFISGLSNETCVGIVIVSICASGASSNLITHLFKGNVALAISMTVINSIITLFSIPIIVNIALSFFLGVTREINLPLWQTISQIFIISIIPASIGIVVRNYKKTFALFMEKPLKYILPILLGIIFTMKIFLSKGFGGTGISIAEILTLFPFMLLLNFLAMLTGFYVSRLLKLEFKNQFTIAIEVGLHNTALALLISGVILKSNDMQKPAIVYAMFNFFSAILFTLIIKRFYKTKEN